MSVAVCRAACGTPLDAALIEPDGNGLHPSCLQPVGEVLPELESILGWVQSSSARSLQTRVGPSEVGEPCDRALAYKLFGVPRSQDEGMKWAPLVGTWVHDGVARALKAWNARLGRERYLIERRVPVAPEINLDGVCDVYDTDTEEVRDWKLVGKTRLEHYRRHGPGVVYRTQAHLYGRGWENAGWHPRSVRIVFLPRASHILREGYEWAEPYSRAVADAALARLVQIRTVGSALSYGPDYGMWHTVAATTSEDCRFCAWRRPGGVADATGCPGDSAERVARAGASFGRGLVSSAER